MIRSASDVPDGFEAQTDVCVIGSGAGGGVTAGVLAEAGREVLVIEEGPHVPAARMNQREADMYPLLYRDGGNQMTADGGISVLQGRVLGGSTVVNMADVVPVPEGVLEHWRLRYGAARHSVDRVREADAACMAAIDVSHIPADRVNRNNRLLLDGARAIGLEGGRFLHNRVGCIGSGFCLVGCAYDAKRSVALTWIPRALRTGNCLVQTEARVERLLVEGSAVVAAVGSVVDVSTGLPLAPFRVTARHFVLAAGAIHSPLVLLASGLGGDKVGQWLSLQPQTPVAAIFPEEVVPFRGIPQSTFVDSTETATAEEGLGGYRVEGVSATPGMSAVSLAGPPRDVHAFMTAYRRSTSCLCLAPDQPSGRVSVARSGRPKIRYELTSDVERRLRQAVRSAVEAYLAVGAEMVVLPFPDTRPVRSRDDLAQLDDRRILSASSPALSAHPQGTCRMGPDPSRSVVDLDLRVHGIDNLSVPDASVFPTSASSHTMLPVMSFAWLAAQTLAR